MTIFILSPDPAHCRPFYIAQQLQTAAWDHGGTEAEARARMMEHPKYSPEAEPMAYEAALELLRPIADLLNRQGKHCRVAGKLCTSLDEAVRALEGMA